MIEKLNPELTLEIINIFLNTIGDKVYNNITYVLSLGDSAEDKKLNQAFVNLKSDLTQAGLKSEEFFTISRVANGYIFDFNLELLREITHEIAKQFSKEDLSLATIDLINKGPDKRKHSDIESLTNYLVKVMQTKKVASSNINIALFSRNIVPKIILAAEDAQKKPVKIDINAYALKHTDLMQVNQHLKAQGYAIKSLAMGEILPSKTGVRASLNIIALNKAN